MAPTGPWPTTMAVVSPSSSSGSGVGGLGALRSRRRLKGSTNRKSSGLSVMLMTDAATSA